MRDLRRALWGIRIIYVFVYSMFSSWLARFLLWIFGVKQIGGGFVVTGFLRTTIHPDSEIVVGNNVRINSGFERNVVGGYRQMTIDIGSRAKLIIGNQTALSNSTIVCRQLIAIGDHVFIGGGCNIYDTDFHSLDPQKRQDKFQVPMTAPIIFDNHCFIGAHTTILKGVTVGEGAIIGAGSVVAKNIPPYEIWAGNPVRFIKKVKDYD